MRACNLDLVIMTVDVASAVSLPYQHKHRHSRAAACLQSCHFLFHLGSNAARLFMLVALHNWNVNYFWYFWYKSMKNSNNFSCQNREKFPILSECMLRVDLSFVATSRAYIPRALNLYRPFIVSSWTRLPECWYRYNSPNVDGPLLYVPREINDLNKERGIQTVIWV